MNDIRFAPLCLNSNERMLASCGPTLKQSCSSPVTVLPNYFLDGGGDTWCKKNDVDVKDDCPETKDTIVVKPLPPV